MKKTKVLTGYTGESDLGVTQIADAIIAGCTSNLKFTFTHSELIDLVAGRDDYTQKLALVPTGTHADVTNKDDAKVVLINALRVICKEINRQHEGDTAILETCGAPLANAGPQPKGGDYPSPEGLDAEAGSKTTELDVKTNRQAGLNDHGIIVAITDAATAPDDVLLWRKESATGHKLTIGGLKPATKYLLACAYQRKAGEKLIWSKTIIGYTKLG